GGSANLRRNTIAALRCQGSHVLETTGRSLRSSPRVPTLIPTPQTPDPKHQTSHIQHHSPNSKHQTPNPKP
ncbi:hypothetical protein T484DRAFT_3649485, partial [Baffinella frigidus]